MPAVPDSTSEAPHRFYATVWRWHFYAGLFAAPFLLILAVTGAIYLFNDELNDLIYPELRFAASAVPAMPPGRLIRNVEAAYPGATVTRIDMPLEPERTAQVFLTDIDGEALRVFVDPGIGKVLGSYVYTKTLVGFADVAHGSLMLGEFGDAIVELAASWALVLVGTGVYLWWPRGSQRFIDVMVPRLRFTGRRLWREIHKTVGVLSVLLVVFLIVTGLPWASIWGGKFLNPMINAVGLGYPPGSRHMAPQSGMQIRDAIDRAPWTLQQAPLPASADAIPDPHADHRAAKSDAGSGSSADRESVGGDEIAAELKRLGLNGGYRLQLPRGPRGVYTAIVYPDRPEGQRTIHFDRYSGRILSDISFRDYGAVAKAVEWGVSLHMGNYFGLANQIIMLLACIAIVVLVISGMVMWWRRRLPGTLGVPAVPAPTRLGTLAGMALLMCTLLPMAGLSLLVVLVLDRAWELTFGRHA